MRFKGISLREAYETVKNKRDIEPNEGKEAIITVNYKYTHTLKKGFAKQLIKYEEKLFGKTTMQLSDFEFNED